MAIDLIRNFQDYWRRTSEMAQGLIPNATSAARERGWFDQETEQQLNQMIPGAVGGVGSGIVADVFPGLAPFVNTGQSVYQNQQLLDDLRTVRNADQGLDRGVENFISRAASTPGRSAERQLQGRSVQPMPRPLPPTVGPRREPISTAPAYTQQDAVVADSPGKNWSSVAQEFGASYGSSPANKDWLPVARQHNKDWQPVARQYSEPFQSADERTPFTAWEEGPDGEMRWSARRLLNSIISRDNYRESEAPSSPPSFGRKKSAGPVSSGTISGRTDYRFNDVARDYGNRPTGRFDDVVRSYGSRPTDRFNDVARNYGNRPTGRFDDVTHDYGNRPTGRFADVAEEYRNRNNSPAPSAPSPAATPQPGASSSAALDALRQAIIGQESNNNYQAINPDSGALGFAQIMPSNMSFGGADQSAAWDVQALGRGVTRDEFLNNPDLQLQIINHQLGSQLERNLEAAGGDLATGVRRTASQWYSGNPELWNNTRPQSYGGNSYPSIADYTSSVYDRFQGYYGR
jgi:hypothetical protein